MKRKINIPIYDHFDLTIVVTNKFLKTAKKLSKGEVNTNYEGVFFTVKDELDLYVVFDKQYLKPSIVAHECLHVAIHILNDVGIKICSESEEAFTYLQAYLINKVYEIICI